MERNFSDTLLQSLIGEGIANNPISKLQWQESKELLPLHGRAGWHCYRILMQCHRRFSKGSIYPVRLSGGLPVIYHQ